MRIIRPVSLDTASLVSNVTEDDHPVWDSGTAYNIGDNVIVIGTVHKAYEALTNNSNKYPPDNPSDWLELGYTNRWKMFYAPVAEQTENATSIEVDFEGGGGVINSIALFNLVAETVEVRMTDPTDGLVYDQTVNLTNNTGITSWYEYFFEPIDRLVDMARFDLPPYSSATIEVDINQPGGTAKCGLVVVGLQKAMGDTRFDTSLGITDYSRKDTDVFGNPTIVQRNYSKRASVLLWADMAQVDKIHRLLATYRATPLVWEVSSQYESSLIYGFYRDFDITITYPQFSAYSIDIEGLT